MVTTSTTSLSGLGLTGLSSGLDTSSIVSKLMSIEQAPQTALKTRLSTLSTYRAALQGINSQLASIASAASTASTPGGLNAFTATTDSTTVSASADATANVGSLTFTVGAVAAAQTSVTDAMTSWPDTSSATPSITITTGTGATAKSVPVTAKSANLDDVVAAINGGATGVTATKVAAGTDASGNPQYRLQLRSNSSGTANAFSVAEGGSASGPALPTTTVTTAADASITLYGGTAAQQTVTSSSNTFSNLLTGVGVTVTTTSSTPVTLTIASDPSKAVASAKSLTGSLVSLLSTIATQSAISTSSNTSGGTTSTSTSGSVFTGDSFVRDVNSQLLSAVSAPVNGASLSSIGINLTKTGTITFDQDAFTKAMQSDPAGTMSTFQAVAQRVADAANTISAPYTGTLSTKITSEQGQESQLSSQISDWDARLATIQTQYTNEFNAMEAALSNLSAQSSWLTSQINGLSTSSSKP
ncbi:flagellar filament capping protein FliD [Amnibacterium sp. CER49]|uniref:flagellar filament capping protein FliD n=1 Tax=Amnibacterium sp. CER49 TaxID=3039161 RepID=UPI002447FE79|nr:flagellar filament capping protein FliD [Amnibacterium sp. CER49]MDH2443846.1 flagellar filament capping protein FliD [Amnibacterium sp. CER49]